MELVREQDRHQLYYERFGVLPRQRYIIIVLSLFSLLPTTTTPAPLSLFQVYTRFIYRKEDDCLTII